jgi:hypothetical protein
VGSKRKRSQKDSYETKEANRRGKMKIWYPKKGSQDDGDEESTQGKEEELCKDCGKLEHNRKQLVRFVPMKEEVPKHRITPQ